MPIIFFNKWVIKKISISWMLFHFSTTNKSYTYLLFPSRSTAFDVVTEDELRMNFLRSTFLLARNWQIDISENDNKWKFYRAFLDTFWWIWNFYIQYLNWEHGSSCMWKNNMYCFLKRQRRTKIKAVKQGKVVYR